MVEGNIILTIMSGLLAGVFGGYIVKWGEDLRLFYELKFGIPKKWLGLLEVLSAIIILLLFWMFLIWLNRLMYTHL